MTFPNFRKSFELQLDKNTYLVVYPSVQNSTFFWITVLVLV